MKKKFDVINKVNPISQYLNVGLNGLTEFEAQLSMVADLYIWRRPL